MKKIFVRGVSVTAFSFLIMWGVLAITDLKVFSAFDPISQALAEFELTDYVFSKFREVPNPDKRIVIVNLSQATRRELGQAVSIISQHKPKVIGIDGFFNCEGGFYDTLNCPQLKDTLGNMLLANAISEAGNVVLVSRLLQSHATVEKGLIDVYDSVEYSDPMYMANARPAFANLVTEASYQEDVKICRSFIPKVNVNGKDMLAFSVTMAMIYDSAKTKRFLDRGNEEEIINFRGNINIPNVKVKYLRDKMSNVSEFNAICYAIDWWDFIDNNYDPEIFNNSVVIMGYLGNYLGDAAWEDKFFTPLNSKVAGRANPDMFGPVIHANIVAMILNEDYIDGISLETQVAIAIVMCFLNVLLFFWIDSRFPLLFDGLSVILQIIQIVLVSGLVIFVFARFNVKLDLTLTIGVLAAIGPCFDIYKSVENVVLEWLTKRRKQVLTT